MRKAIVPFLLGLLAVQQVFAQDDNPAKKFADSIRKGGESIVQEVEKGAETLGKGIKKGAESAGKTFGDWFGGKSHKEGNKLKEDNKSEK